MDREKRISPVSEIVEEIALGLEAEPPRPDIGRRRERNFDVLPTHIEGFDLLADHEANPDLTRSETERIHSIGPAYVVRAELIRRLQEIQDEEGGPREELVEMVSDVPGLRGGRDTRSGWEVQVTPRRVSEFDEDSLQASLGDRTSEFVHRKVRVTVDLDPDTDDVEGFVRSVRSRLKRQGSSAEPNVTKTFRVDEKELQKLVESGQVILADNAWTTRVNDIAVTPKAIASDEDRAEADAPLQEELDTQG